jgi:hypothetical protein
MLLGDLVAYMSEGSDLTSQLLFDDSPRMAPGSGGCIFSITSGDNKSGFTGWTGAARPGKPLHEIR